MTNSEKYNEIKNKEYFTQEEYAFLVSVDGQETVNGYTHYIATNGGGSYTSECGTYVDTLWLNLDVYSEYENEVYQYMLETGGYGDFYEDAFDENDPSQYGYSSAEETEEGVLYTF